MAASLPEWSEISGRRAAVPEHVVYRALAEETIMLNVETGRYHGLDAIGGRFFAVLQERTTLGEARDALAAEYGEPSERIQADLVAFCDTLRRLGLVELR